MSKTIQEIIDNKDVLEGLIIHGKPYPENTVKKINKSRKKYGYNPEKEMDILSEVPLHQKGGAHVLWKGKTVFIPGEVLRYSPVYDNLSRFVNSKVSFLLTEEQDGKLIGSAQKVNTFLRDKEVQKLADGKPFEAEVSVVIPYSGIIVDVNGHDAFVAESVMMSDNSHVQDVVNVGSTISFVLKEYTEHREIKIEPVEPLENTEWNQYMNELKENEGRQLRGEIKSIVFLAHGPTAFTEVRPGIDAISEVPEDMVLHEGDKVIFTLNQVDKEAGKVRGRIERKSHEIL